jgi:hypothetical protein
MSLTQPLTLAEHPFRYAPQPTSHCSSSDTGVDSDSEKKFTVRYRTIRERILNLGHE